MLDPVRLRPKRDIFLRVLPAAQFCQLRRRLLSQQAVRAQGEDPRQGETAVPAAAGRKILDPTPQDAAIVAVLS